MSHRPRIKCMVTSPLPTSLSIKCTSLSHQISFQFCWNTWCHLMGRFDVHVWCLWGYTSNPNDKKIIKLVWCWFDVRFDEATTNAMCALTWTFCHIKFPSNNINLPIWCGIIKSGFDAKFDVPRYLRTLALCGALIVTLFSRTYRKRASWY